MESLSDLLRLPVISDCAQDRYFHYNIAACRYYDWDAEEDLYISSYQWRKEEQRKMLEKYHYDNMFRLKQLVTDHKKQIVRFSKGANSELRARPIEHQKLRVIKELQSMESGWSRIAPVLRAESRKLFVLPREIREQIFGYLYTRRKSLTIDFPDLDVRRSLLPPDPFFLLNASIVDPDIAAEAAQVLYDTNTFNLVLRDRTYSQFLLTDHFGSAIIPKDVVRRLHVTLQAKPAHRERSPEAFEDRICRDWQGRNRIGGDRAKLASMVDMPSLKLLILTLKWYCDNANIEYRELSPILKMLKNKGVVVIVYVVLEFSWGYHQIESSSLFNEPSADDWKLAQKVLHLDRKPYEERTAEERQSVTKVQIARQNMAFQRKEWKEKTRALQRAKANIDAILAALSLHC